MRSKILLTLFALPFAGVGLFMGFWIGVTLTDAWQMKQWVPVQATLQRAGFERKSSDNGYTYKAVADYTYEYGGQQYANDRVSISSSSDNIGSYQTDTGRFLQDLRERRETVTVYVNPEEPSEAIIDRSVRWGMIFFKSIFVFMFGGAGVGIIYFLVIRAPEEKDKSDPKYRTNRWLLNDDWQTAVIKSDSKETMWSALLAAIAWNLVCTPMPFLIGVGSHIMVALFGLLFPIVGIYLIYWAVCRAREWKRFGPAPVTLDPFPGAIGGHVGGTFDINMPYDSRAQFSLTLTNLRSYVSGSGKNRSRNESAEWQDTQVAHVSSGAKGTRLSFRFAVPENLKESEAERSEDTYYFWRLNLKADLPGADIDRNYDIPVYETGEKSEALPEISIEQARSKQNKIDLHAVHKVINLMYVAGGGRSMRFPAGRNLATGFGGSFVGAIFTTAGWFMITAGDAPFMGTIFGLMGLLIAGSSLYRVLNSLEVLQEGGYIRTVRRILGIPVKRGQMRQADIVKLRKKASSPKQSGNGQALRYTVSAVDRHGEELLVAEGFKGASQAEGAADLIAQSFGIARSKKTLEIDPRFNPDIDNTNLLTTD